MFSTALFVLVMTTGAKPSYTIVELPPLKGDSISCAGAINDSDVVVGWSGSPTRKVGECHTQATVWVSGRPKAIGPKNSVAVAVNNHETVLGGRIMTTMVAWTWSNGKVRPLKCPGAKSIEVAAINDQDVVVGAYTDSQNEYHLAVWRSGRLQDQFTRYNAFGLAISDRNEIVGLIHQPNVVKAKGMKIDLATEKLTIYPEMCWGINDLGVIISRSPLEVLSGKDRQLPDGCADVTASRINALGLIVGCVGFGRSQRACLVSDKVYDLNTLIKGGNGWLLESADAISGHGVIVGNGVENGKRRAFMLVPSSR